LNFYIKNFIVILKKWRPENTKANFHNSKNTSKFHIDRKFQNYDNNAKYNIERKFENEDNYAYYKLGIEQPPPKRVIIKGFDD